MLIASVKNNLCEIIQLLNQLKDEEYTQKHFELSEATIGQHTRHIIELYQCLFNSYEIGIVNYDLRERNKVIENQTCEAIKAIENLLQKVEKANKQIIIEQGTSTEKFQIESNYNRELLYNLEHSIHHQALIKVALFKFPHIAIDKDFGVARSTIEFRLQCAQ